MGKNSNRKLFDGWRYIWYNSNEWTKGDVNTWLNVATLVGFVTMGLFFTSAVLRMCAFFKLFPNTRADVFELYPSIMGISPTFFFAVETLAYILLAFNLGNDATVILSRGDAKHKMYHLRQSNFCHNGVLMSLYFSLTIVADMLLWYDYSPYYFFGFTIGSLVPLILINQWGMIRFILKMIFNVLNMEGRENARRERLQYDSWNFIIEPPEWAMWQLPALVLQAHTLVLSFSSLFAAAEFFDQQLGDVNKETLFIILSWVFIFTGSALFEIYAKSSGSYAYILSFLLASMAINQSGATLPGPDPVAPYPIAWKSTTAMVAVLFTMGVFASFRSIKARLTYVNHFRMTHANDEKAAAFLMHEHRSGLLSLCWPGNMHGSEYEDDHLMKSAA